MINRRPLLLALAATLATRAAHAAYPWRRDVSELRFALSGEDARPWADRLHRRLGVPVRAVRAQGGSLARELDRGHVEFALLDRATLSAARARMQHRLIAGPVRPDGRILVMRGVLPPAMRHDLGAALA